VHARRRRGTRATLAAICGDDARSACCYAAREKGDIGVPYVITFVDDPDVREKKVQIRGIHLEHVERNAHRIIASGGFFPEEDDFPNGGMIILDVDNRAEAVEYIESDPFFINGIFSKYTIARWRKFIFDHKRVQA
jgi:uncharacterized protein YciI